MWNNKEGNEVGPLGDSPAERLMECHSWCVLPGKSFCCLFTEPWSTGNGQSHIFLKVIRRCLLMAVAYKSYNTIRMIPESCMLTLSNFFFQVSYHCGLQTSQIRVHTLNLVGPFYSNTQSFLSSYFSLLLVLTIWSSRERALSYSSHAKHSSSSLKKGPFCYLLLTSSSTCLSYSVFDPSILVYRERQEI